MKSKKRRLLFTLIPAAALLLLGFVFLRPSMEQENDPDRRDPYSEVYVYPMEGVSSFCVGENGTIYLTQKGSNLIQAYDSSGEMLREYPMEADGITNIGTGRYVDMGDGLQVWNARPDDDLVGLCSQEGRLYCYRTGTGALLSLDAATGNCDVLWQAEGEVRREILAKLEKLESPYLTVRELAVSGDAAALLVMGNYDPRDRLTGADNNDNYLYLGERLLLVDLRSGSWLLTEHRNLTAVAAKGADGFLISGYDKELGHYFAELSPEGALSEKIPTGINHSLTFAWDEENEMFHGALSITNAPYCVSGSLSSPGTAYRYYSSNMNLDNGSVRWSEGCLYLLNIRSKKILRLKPELFFQDSVPLKALALNLYELPDWQGYPVEVEILMKNQLAMKLLSGDDDFDLVILSTDMAAAWNLKRVMAYAPLNHAAGAAMEGCFPGVRRAAMNGDDIWMLPLSLNMTALIYSEENLEKAGVSPSQAAGLDDWADIISDLHGQGLEDLYAFPYASVRNHLMRSYLNRHLEDDGISFHTEEFEAILGLLTSLKQNPAILESYGLSYPDERYAYIFDYVIKELWDSPDRFDIAVRAAEEAFRRDILVEWATRRDQYQSYQGFEGFSIRPVPDAANAGGFEAYADILVVNPNSEHLRETLLLVESMADSVVSDPRKCLSADRSIYPKDAFSGQLYECLSRSEIYQVPPPEIYDQYYMEYFDGALTHDELLDTLERVLNAYYFE